MARERIDPTFPEEMQPTIGLIGMGEMGRMYANELSNAGWKTINVCDLPKKFEELKNAYEGVPGVNVLFDGHLVSETSDFIIYSVEAEFIESVVEQYGPSTKRGAIVAGQTSVKAPEKDAFERNLPPETQIVSVHSLHGPTVSPVGQPLVLIKHRATDEALYLVEDILRPLQSRFVYLSYEEHDVVTANTQAVTHAAFLSMGTAWCSSLSYPWEEGKYVGGIETVKVNIMLRIYSNKWHVYAGLALFNPSARVQIDQYAKSAMELFKVMLEGKRAELHRRLYLARAKVFDSPGRIAILLSEDVLNQFSLGRLPPDPDSALLHPDAQQGELANSHLSLLAMVDSWAALDINPFAHLQLAATPVFRLWIGVAEYLFRSEERLDAAIDAAVNDVWHRADDLEFVIAARGWSQCVRFGNFELYRVRFEQTAEFFNARFEEADKVGSRMIKAISDSSL